ncbi:DUF3566 domain-containing protein [Isoptericola aurantiacus]|uniref:DUF3566 domain-containing protein n=1 Tax=Isoptericola aurantiacus TaxID=3377839 RepID=UPI00383A535D
MASDNTSPRAGTTTADAAESTQQLAPVPAPQTPTRDGSSTPSNGSASNGSAPNGAAGTERGTTAQGSETPHRTGASTSEVPQGAGTEQAASPVKDGAVKAAAAALAAARTAAKKVQSAASATSAGATPENRSGTPSSTPPPPPAPDAAQPDQRPQMHYSAGGVRGSAQQVPLADGQPGAAPQTGAQPMAAEAVGGVRRVRLSVSRVDPWSVMKLAFLLSFAIGIMVVVATTVVWYSLNSLGTFATIQDFLVETLGPQAIDITQFVELNRMLSLSMLIALVNMVLMTALATILAILYNITAALVGGVHLTLTDE